MVRPPPGSVATADFSSRDVVVERAAVRQNIGLVFQDTTLDDYLTAEENLRSHAEGRRHPPQRDAVRAAS